MHAAGSSVRHASFIIDLLDLAITRGDRTGIVRLSGARPNWDPRARSPQSLRYHLPQ
jgi:hypothetical protein